MNKTAFLSLCLLCFVFSCRKEKPDPLAGLKIEVEHSVNGSPLIVDEMRYLNAAGNQYMITEIQWFISHLSLVKADGSVLAVAPENPIHYVDTDIPESQTMLLTQKLEPGDYTALRFVFGLNETDNKSGRFVNPPESFMFWPEHLGGGYHYMKLNGKWKNLYGQDEPFNFHLGIGQVSDDSTADTRFVQNYFEVDLPGLIRLEEGKTTVLRLNMRIEQWFSAQHIYDFNFWGGHIMQNQPAMQQACENGRHAFSFRSSN